MKNSLTVILRENDLPARLVVLGEVDISNKEIFREALAHAAARQRRLVVDLTAVEFLGAAGLSALSDYSDHLTAVLVTMHSITSRALELSEINTRVAYQPSRNAPRTFSDGPVSVPRPRDGAEIGHSKMKPGGSC